MPMGGCSEHLGGNMKNTFTPHGVEKKNQPPLDGKKKITPPIFFQESPSPHQHIK